MPPVLLRHRHRATVPLLFAALAVATLVPIWGEPGWPVSHEGYAFSLRTHIYARHFSWLDLAPIWSSVDAQGFGSPMPLMYHKLFYVVAGAFALVLPSLKAADLTAIALLLVAGAGGTYGTARAVGASRLAATIAGCCLIAANYTVTNWLVRGALGEFSAAMLAPWVFKCFVRTLQTGRATVGLGVSLGLMWLAHSVLAFYAGLLLSATYLLLAIGRLAPRSVADPRAAWPAVAWFAALVAPALSLMATLGRDYDLGRMLTYPFQPAHQFRPLTAYFWEPYWRFGRTESGLTVELDHAMVVLAAASLGALVWTPPVAGSGRRRRDVVGPVLPFLIVILLGGVLQLPIAGLFYERFPGAVFLQFPWRLLALITPALVVSAVCLADQVWRSETRTFVLGAATAWMLAGCGAFVPLEDRRIALDPPELGSVVFSGFREYEPRAARPVSEIRPALEARWTEAGCVFTRLDDDEVPIARFRTSCGRATTLPLPLFASALHSVATMAAARSQPCLSIPEFAGVCGASIAAGDDTVAVRLPTVAAAAWQVLRSRTIWP